MAERAPLPQEESIESHAAQVTGGQSLAERLAQPLEEEAHADKAAREASQRGLAHISPPSALERALSEVQRQLSESPIPRELAILSRAQTVTAPLAQQRVASKP